MSPPAVSRNDHPVRFAVAAFAAGAGAVHGSVISAHLRVFWLFGVFFAFAAAAQVAWAVLVLLRPTARVIAAGALGNAMLVAVWGVSRTVGVPVGPTPGAPESVGLLDLLATGYEALAVAGAFVLLYRPAALRVGRIATRLLGGAVGTAVALGTAAAIASARPWAGLEASGGAGGRAAGAHAVHFAMLFAAVFAYGAYIVREIGRNGWPGLSWRLRSAPPER